MAISQADIVKMMKEFSANEEHWAKKSKYYGRIMSDGNIFNPYLHRRFLPGQFKNLLNHTFYYGTYPTKKQFIVASSHTCSPHHIIDSVTKEVRLLAFLEHKDQMAFEERSAIMPLDNCKRAYATLLEYLSEHCVTTLWRAPRLNDEVREYRKKIERAKSYAELDRILHEPWQTTFSYYGESKFVTVAKVYNAYWTGSCYEFTQRGCMEFYNMFLLSGAYYSLKNYYMFDESVENRREKLKALYDLAITQRDWSDLTNRYCRLIGMDAKIESEEK